MNLIGRKARKASEYKITTKVKNKVLNDYAKLIKNEKKFIINQNSKDINYARKKGLKENLIKRLHLNENKLDGIINSILKIAKLRDPIDSTLEKWKRPNGLNIKRVSIPIGVIGVIYESRPNVTSDVASLCFKSGNVVILKGGSEAINSNKALAKLFRKALKKNKVNENFIQFIDSKQRRLVDIMLSKMKKYIDVIIPRGGKNLVKKVSGRFNKGDHIKVLDKKNNECARGLSSFTSDEVNKIMGHHSNEIEKLLGYVAKSEVIHKDDMVEI